MRVRRFVGVVRLACGSGAEKGRFIVQTRAGTFAFEGHQGQLFLEFWYIDLKSCCSTISGTLN